MFLSLPRVIHLAKYYPPFRGGIETHVQTLARSQAKLGCDVYVICINHLDEQGQPRLRTKTTHELDCGVKIIRVSRWGSFARFDLCPGIARATRRLIEDPQTIVHLHTPNPTMVLALVRVLKPMRMVITHHSDVIKQKLLKYALRPFELIVYGQSKLILATSAEYIQGSRFLNFYRRKLDYLPLALDSADYANPSPEVIAYSRQLKDLYGDGPIWLSVGRLTYYKAYPVAIEALQWVPGRLLIIGVGGLEAELKALAQKFGVGDRLVWLGAVTDDQLIGAYHAATALWFPSNVRSEGFGLVQVEAMACGCPVINADIICSGVPWVSRHEQEALTVPTDDPQALAQAANRLLKEPGLRERLVAGGRERAKFFDPRTMGKKSLDFYQQVLERGHR